LDVADTEQSRIMAIFSLSFNLGHDGNFHLLDREHFIFLPWCAAGSGDGARSLERLAASFVPNTILGWHSSIFGPYFVVGALYSGVAAVIIVLAIIRKAMHLEYFLRDEHFQGMGKFLLILSFTWAYFYFADYITAWYGRQPVEKTILDLFSHGFASPFWITMLVCNLLIPVATLWSKKIRGSIPALLLVCIFVQIGMYLERYLIVNVSLGQNELPFSWGVYVPHLPEILVTIGSFALVAFLYTLFSRIIPLIPVWEIQEGQMLQGLRRVGRALIPTRIEPD